MTIVSHEDTDGSFQARLIQGVYDVNITRYASAAGLVLLLYDSVLTFADSVDFIRNATPSPAKNVFLLNRYLVPLSQICVAILMNHYGAGGISDLACRVTLVFAFIAGVISIASANVLVMLRVAALWEHDHGIIRLLILGFCISFLVTIGFSAETLFRSVPGIGYGASVHSCVSTIKAPLLPGVWASSLAFEIIVLILVVFNALSRPRGTSTPLRRVLLRDGILFFASLTVLRLANFIIALIARPTLSASGVSFIWAMITLVLNRSLLSIHKATSEAAHVRISSRASREDREQGTHAEEYPLQFVGGHKESREPQQPVADLR